MTLQCQACKGTYTDTLPDGTLYFHVCPPLAAWEVRKAIAANASPLTAAQTAQLTALDAQPFNAANGETATGRGDNYLAGLGLPRPNARNENIDPAKIESAPKDAQGNVKQTVDPSTLMISAGAGVAPVVVTDGVVQPTS